MLHFSGHVAQVDSKQDHHQVLMHRFYHHVIGKDFEGVHVLPGWGISADVQSTNIMEDNR